MSELTLREIGINHKHWLAEIERWEGYLRLWNQQHATLAHDVEQVIQEHGRQLSDHAQSLKALQHNIADCERAMSKSDLAELVSRHSKDTTWHQQQRVVHERLKAAHHTLMLALALLKGEPFREE